MCVHIMLYVYVTTDGWYVKDVGIAFGGMAPTTVMAGKTMTYLQGKRWCEDTLNGAYATLDEV